MIRIDLPAGAPGWLAATSLASVLLIGLIYSLAWLIRGVLPTTPAERLDWWKYYWQHRRELRRDRWRRHDRRNALRHGISSSELSRFLSGAQEKKSATGTGRGSNGSSGNHAPVQASGRLSRSRSRPARMAIQPSTAIGKSPVEADPGLGPPQAEGETLASAVSQALPKE